MGLARSGRLHSQQLAPALLIPLQQGSRSHNCVCIAGLEVRDHHPVLQLPDASAQGPVVRAGLYPRLEADVCS